MPKYPRASQTLFQNLRKSEAAAQLGSTHQSTARKLIKFRKGQSRSIAWVWHQVSFDESEAGIPTVTLHISEILY